MVNTRSKRKEELKQTTLDDSAAIETPPPKKSKKNNGQEKAEKVDKAENGNGIADTANKNTMTTSNNDDSKSTDTKATNGNNSGSNGKTFSSNDSKAHNSDKNVEDLECPPLGEGTLEKGSIAFFYRPKVDKEEAASVNDVQSLVMLLIPSSAGATSATAPNEEGGEKQAILKRKYRLIDIGKKRLPDVKAHEAFWAAVVTVDDNLNHLESGFGEKHYDTKTLGERTVGAARLVGKGVYSVVQNGSKTHLAYMLQTPVLEVQEEFALKNAATYTLQLKNPEVPGPSFASLPEKSRVHYPKSFQERFRTKWMAANPPALMDFSGVEMLLIGGQEGHQGLIKSLGEEDAKELEYLLKEDGGQLDEKRVFSELQLSQKEIPDEPLTGEWI